MTDIVDQNTRSRMMAGIKGKNTKPEIVLRKALHARGFRYRLYDKRLPGKPDLVLPKFRAVIFVHGCFWHRHRNCKYATTPKTRAEFWNSKFEGNLKRDKSVQAQLLSSFIRVGIVWECQIMKNGQDEVTASAVANWLLGDEMEFEMPMAA